MLTDDLVQTRVGPVLSALVFLCSYVPWLVNSVEHAFLVLFMASGSYRLSASFSVGFFELWGEEFDGKSKRYALLNSPDQEVVLLIISSPVMTNLVVI